MDGILKREVFPGLWLDTAAVIQADVGRVLAVLQQGLASPEHAAFVSMLPTKPRLNKNARGTRDGN